MKIPFLGYPDVSGVAPSEFAIQDAVTAQDDALGFDLEIEKSGWGAISEL